MNASLKWGQKGKVITWQCGLTKKYEPIRFNWPEKEDQALENYLKYFIRRFNLGRVYLYEGCIKSKVWQNLSSRGNTDTPARMKS